MDQNLDKKIEFKDKLVIFFKDNKAKILLFLSIIVLGLFISIFLKIYYDKKNIQISEQFITAGLYLSSQEFEKSKQIYEKIIMSKSKFYATLSLDTIVEKNLEKDQSKILNYFNIIEDLDHSKEKKDLILFKKALYLINNSKESEGKKILNNLIENNSNIQSLAEDILQK